MLASLLGEEFIKSIKHVDDEGFDSRASERFLCLDEFAQQINAEIIAKSGVERLALR